MKKKLMETTKDALSSVLPITAVVFLLSITIAPIPVGTLSLFLFGAVLLVLGMGLFIMGVDMSLVPLGEGVGVKMTMSKKTVLVVLVSFIMGFIITAAEPDLQVLAGLVPGVPSAALILTVSAGVGMFLLFAIFRILFRISLSKMLIACYAIAIALSFYTPHNFIAVAFDSGGVTTGPVTVPFIMAMGLGLASIRSDKDSLEDSFGLVALCSIGPILAVMILGIFYHPVGAYDPPVIPEIVTSQDMALEFVHQFPHYLLEVAGSVWPIPTVALLFQLFTRRYHKIELARIFIGFLYTFFGLVLFLTGVNTGFIPIGQYIGQHIASSPGKWLLVPLGAVIGYFIVAAEPAVHVLKKQVEEVSGGGIPGHAVQRYLSIGTSAALALSMLRVLTGLSIYWLLIPGYTAALVLTRFVPKIFTGIAFDSGGVVSGPMTSTFLLPFAIGACTDPGKIMTDAFGLVALVAMAPLIALQLMGVIYKNRIGRAAVPQAEVTTDEIIEFEESPPDEQ